jgi:hypothetical protein
MVLIELTQTDIFVFIGQVVVIISLTTLFISLIASILIVYSFITGRFLFPNFMLSIIVLLEGVLKAIFRLVILDDSIIDRTAIQLQNKVSFRQFHKIPNNERMIFFPQCLRSIECPSKLSPEGLQCIKCGRCEIGNAKEKAEDLGYKVFIVPGSSFIKRMVEKYHPKGIIGIGCKFEVKNGLDMCSNIGLVGVGMELETSGCLATELDWEKFYELLEQ